MAGQNKQTTRRSGGGRTTVGTTQDHAASCLCERLLALPGSASPPAPLCSFLPDTSAGLLHRRTGARLPPPRHATPPATSTLKVTAAAEWRRSATRSSRRCCLPAPASSRCVRGVPPSLSDGPVYAQAFSVAQLFQDRAKIRKRKGVLAWHFALRFSPAMKEGISRLVHYDTPETTCRSHQSGVARPFKINHFLIPSQLFPPSNCVVLPWPAPPACVLHCAVGG